MSGPSAFGITAGIVAYNEEARIEGAIDSLLDQELPDGVTWSEIRVLASGCSDRTGEVVRAAFGDEPRVRLEEEPTRAGKAAALAKLFLGVSDPWFVLLDGDCRAEPRAVAALLAAARIAPDGPVAVGGRHIPPRLPGHFGRAITLAWAILNDRAAASPPNTRGQILLDNLALFSTDPLPSIVPGVINEARWLEAEVLRAAGVVLYAVDAGVMVSVPTGYGGLIAFRRRVLDGHRQLRPALGPEPALVGRDLGQHPASAVREILGTARRERSGLAALFGLAGAELTAHLLARLDGARGSSPNSQWPRIPAAGAAGEGPT